MATLATDMTPYEEEIVEKILLEFDKHELRTVEIWTDMVVDETMVTVTYQPGEGIEVNRRNYIYKEEKLCPIDS